MSKHPIALHCFVALLDAFARPPAPFDLGQLVRSWPPVLAARLLAIVPGDTFIAACLVLPDLKTAVQLAQVLRHAGLDGLNDERIFKHLEALHARNPARAFTLRRAMEWSVQDTAFWPERHDWPSDANARAVEVALLAERDWINLPLPCVHRLPAPGDNPDVWPEAAQTLPVLSLPEQVDPAHDCLRAGIEWLHLWRLDAELPQSIRAAVPAETFTAWIGALDRATRPEATKPLHRDMVLFEHLAEPHADALSLLEIDALLKGVSEPAEDEDWFGYDAEGRVYIRDAVRGWLDKAGVESWS